MEKQKYEQVSSMLDPEGHDKITHVRMKNGTVHAVKLASGLILSGREAIDLNNTGKHLVDYTTGVSITGTEYLRALPDQELENNLRELPEF